MTTLKKAKTGIDHSLTYFENIEYALAKERVIHVMSPVSVGLAHSLSAQLTYLGSVNHNPVTIIMNTPGGSVLDGLAVYDTIKSLNEKVPVDIVTVGSCMSMGAVILQAARRRIAAPHCHFLLHEIAFGASGSLSQISDEQKFGMKLQDMILEILSSRSGIPPKKLAKLFFRQDCYLGANEAFDLGLVDVVTDKYGEK